MHGLCLPEFYIARPSLNWDFWDTIWDILDTEIIHQLGLLGYGFFQLGQNGYLLNINFYSVLFIVICFLFNFVVHTS